MNTKRWHYIVYLIWNRDNGYIYIGQHRTMNPNDSYMGSGADIKKVYAEYQLAGKDIRDHFEKIILYDFDTFEEMNDMEKLLVSKEFIDFTCVYNKTIGGSSKYTKNNKLKLTYNGSTYTFNDWADILGVPVNRLRNRIYHGWSIKDTIETPPVERNKSYTYHGITKTVSEWAEWLNVDQHTLTNRLGAGWTLTEFIDRDLGATRESKRQQFEFNGEFHSLKRWSKITGIPLAVLNQRKSDGWPVEKMLTQPHHFDPKVKPITFRGETKSLREWAKEYGIRFKLAEARRSWGWDIEKILTTPVQRQSNNGKLYTYGGKTMTAPEWARYSGIPYAKLISRLNHGQTIEHALNTPFKNRK